ncbi:unnamed protein product [Symbiodinium necroappetens]|uniref:Uncharacterized protein n=1 Tax=Symbiodinium necroappetens TaxID=1628268 RepID=A0A812QC19_9DINO|nr:unnamed protein product [Symbiodinium necroappetens]
MRSFPCRAAAFCSTEATSEIREEILKAAEEEYRMIKEIEAAASGASVLKQHGLHTTFQMYREIMATMQLHQFKDCKAIEDIVQAWYPPWGQSSCLEQVFRELEQATKRVGHVGDSMSNLTCVAVRALERRVCSDEQTPVTPSLCEKDWQGQVVRNLKDKMWHPTSAPACKNVKIDDIIKPFTTMTAYSQIGTSPIDSISCMWVAGCFRVLRLKEVSWKFAGKLLPEKLDERRMPKNMKEFKDPFSEETEETRALVLDNGTCSSIVSVDFTMLPGPEQTGEQTVEIFEYTIHVSPASLECKCGGILIRRGSKPYSLLVHLFISETILSITSAALSEILTAYEARMPKNSSKHAKIRKLLTLADVKETLGDHGVARMEQKLQDEKAEEEDPAVAACNQLLAELDAEEEKEEEKEEATDARQHSVQ